MKNKPVQSRRLLLCSMTVWKRVHWERPVNHDAAGGSWPERGNVRLSTLPSPEE